MTAPAKEPETTEKPRATIRPWMVVPALGAFMVLSSFLVGLSREDTETLPSALIDRPAPEFALNGLAGTPGLSTADLKEPGVKLVNIWASWCVPCRIEHPWIKGLAEEGLTVHGINYKDTPEGATAFLDELGNPFTRIGADTTGRTGLDWGVYGVPETFVLDSEGRIVYKHVGPIQAGDIAKRLRPAIEEAQRRSRATPSG
ncbi:MAG: DsbE family thiol:disulfide interchange protein [Pseudomonadota bacterium]